MGHGVNSSQPHAAQTLRWTVQYLLLSKQEGHVWQTVNGRIRSRHGFSEEPCTRVTEKSGHKIWYEYGALAKRPDFFCQPRALYGL